ncbi:YitT family protein [Enterococcus sp. LJL98]
MEKRQHIEFLKKIGTIGITGLLNAIGMNYFLTPGNILSAGVNGISQITVEVVQRQFHLSLSMGALIFLFNIPVFILGFIKLGKDAMIFSFINVLVVSIMIMSFPEGQFTDNILLNAIVGGVLIGGGVGLSLKMGFTTGGMDVLSLIFSKMTGKTVGNYMMALNGIIVLMAASIFSVESALFTVISLYAMSRVIDLIHTNHQKVTALIITTKPDEVGKNISERLYRGMTLLPSVGGYSGLPSSTIMIVVTRYELYDLEQAAMEMDEKVFINVLPTHSITGHFATDDEQRTFKATGSLTTNKVRRNR